MTTETEDPVHPAEEAAIFAANIAKKPRRSRAKKAPDGEPMTEVLTGDVLPADVAAEEKGLVKLEPLPRADHHIVTGMAALARMNDADYEQAISSVVRGMERVRDFQQRAMTKGEDYGVVKGIDRPFLHLPGAEKLILLYGLAARQEAERIVGERVRYVSSDGAEIVTGEWLSPPLAYHVKTYIHVGSFDGPVVAMGYGEASSWETKYRYVYEKPTCPNCAHELMRGGKEGKMAGKWFCPGFKGGCWWSTDIAAKNHDGTPVISPPGKVENPDPHSLAETLIQMAAKRSFVAATRRATGTSGLFTQDEDSPSVLAQQEGAPDDDTGQPLVETVAPTQEVARGGKVEKPSQAQINRLGALSKEKDLGPVKLGEVFTRVTGQAVNFGEVTDRAQQSAILLAAIQSRTADEIGLVIQAVETGEVPEETPAVAPEVTSIGVTPEPGKSLDDLPW